MSGGFEHLMSDKVRAILRAQDLSPLVSQELSSQKVRLQNVTEPGRESFQPRAAGGLGTTQSMLEELLA